MVAYSSIGGYLGYIHSLYNTVSPTDIAAVRARA